MEVFSTTWKILVPLFKYPTQGLTIRKIAKLANISHPPAIRLIKRLEEQGMVSIERRGRMSMVKGNLENIKFAELKKIYNILSLRQLTSFLVEEYSPEVIICFGSYSRGTDFEDSDIDIYVGYKKIDFELEEKLPKFENQLKRKIQIFSGNLSKFSKELRENIINGVKLHGWLKL